MVQPAEACVVQAGDTLVSSYVAALSPVEQLGWQKTPRYTKTGYCVTSLPRSLREQLLAFHEQSAPLPEESCSGLHGHTLLANLSGTELEQTLCQYLLASGN